MKPINSDEVFEELIIQEFASKNINFDPTKTHDYIDDNYSAILDCFVNVFNKIQGYETD